MPIRIPGTRRTDSKPLTRSRQPAKGAAQRSRFGIGPRLLIAFGASALLTLIASTVAWISFGQIGGAVTTTMDTNVPAMVLALEIAEQSEALAAGAPRLAAAKSQEERSRQSGILQEQSEAIRQRLSKLSALLQDPGVAEALGGLVDISVEDLRQIGALVDERLRLEAQRRAVYGEIGVIQQDILAKIVPAVDDANFELIIGAETAAEGGAEATQAFLEEGVGALRVLMTVEAEMNLIAGLLADTLGATNVADIQPKVERFTAARSRLVENIAILPEGEASDEIKQALERLIGFGDNAEVNAFDVRRRELTVDSEAQALMARTQETSDALGKRVEDLAIKARNQAKASGDRLAETIATARFFLFLIAAVSLAGAALIAWLYVLRSLVRRLTGLAESMSKLAAGDLKAEVETAGNDEVAVMAQTLGVFRDGLAEVEVANARAEEERKAATAQRRESMLQLADNFESRVSGVVDGLSSAATQLQGTAQTMSDAAEATSSDARKVGAASDQASDNVTTVSSATTELSGSIDEISQQVSKSSSITRNAVAQAEQTNRQVEGLAEAAQKIGEVVSLISDIAEQTNLLALNATIEAARAGDAGKGFAVVANEVKSLATQTAKATEEIGQQIGRIQTETNTAVSAIKEITGTIVRIDEISTTITAAVEEQRASTGEIARSVDQAANRTADVSRTIQGVAEAAGRTGDSAGQVLSAAEDLAEQSATLRVEVDRLLEEVRAG